MLIVRGQRRGQFERALFLEARYVRRFLTSPMVDIPRGKYIGRRLGADPPKNEAEHFIREIAILSDGTGRGLGAVTHGPRPEIASQSARANDAERTTSRV